MRAYGSVRLGTGVYAPEPGPPDVKPCARCGETIVRGTDELFGAWRARVECDTCASPAARRARAAARPVPDGAKTCEACGGSYTRPHGCSPSRWAKRKYCSQECGRVGSARARAEARATEAKTCEACGGSFTRRRDQNKQGWLKHKYCTPGCAQEASRRVQAAARARDVRTCAQCGVSYTRSRHCAPSHWAKRKFCSLGCARDSNLPVLLAHAAARALR